MAKTLAIPSNFDIDHALSGLAIGRGPRANYCDGAYYLVHLLTIRPNNSYEFDDDTYRPLSSKLNEEIIGKKEYSIIRQCLIVNGIIEKIDRYQVKKACKKFRLHLDYQTGEITNIEITGRLARRIDKAYKSDNEAHAALTKKYAYLENQFKNHTLTLDGVKDKIVSMVNERIRDIEGNGNMVYYDSLYNKLGLCQQAINNINNGRNNFNPSTANHRISSALTSLPKYARVNLKIDGLSFVELDLRSSQPFMLLCALSKREFFTGENKGFNCETIYPELKKKFLGVVPDYISSFQRNPQAIGELNRFRSALSTDIYEYMREQGERYQPQLFGKHSILRDRDQIKDKFMQTLFDNDYDHRRFNPVTVLFKNLFPAINTFIYSIMRDFGDNSLPYLLQRIEAYLVLDVACRELYEKDESVPIFTIHDAVITTAKNGSWVKDRMISSIFNTTGITPIIVEKHTNEPNIDGLFETDSKKKDINRFKFKSVMDRGKAMLAGM